MEENKQGFFAEDCKDQQSAAGDLMHQEREGEK